MYENNIFKEQAWELQGAEAVGITLSMFRFMLSFFASVGIGALLRFVPTTAGDDIFTEIVGRNFVFEKCFGYFIVSRS